MNDLINVTKSLKNVPNITKNVPNITNFVYPFSFITNITNCATRTELYFFNKLKVFYLTNRNIKLCCYL